MTYSIQSQCVKGTLYLKMLNIHSTNLQHSRNSIGNFLLDTEGAIHHLYKGSNFIQ